MKLLMKTQMPLLARYIIGLSVLCLFSCRHKMPDDHPEYFAKYFAQMDTAFSENDSRKIIMRSLDSVIKRVPVGEGDLIKYYKYKVVQYKDAENFEKAFVYVDSVQAIAEKRSNEAAFTEVYAGALMLKSDCYMMLKNYDAAMKYLLKSKSEFSKTDQPACKYWIYNERTADLLYRQTRYMPAITYYKKALQQINECAEDADVKFSVIQRHFDDIGLCYDGAGKQDSAAYFYQTALDYITQNEHKFPQRAGFINLAKAVVYGNIAKIKRKERRYAESESLNLLSLQGTAPFYKEFTLITEFELVNLYIDWGKIKDAGDLLSQIKNSRVLEDSSSAEQKTTWYLSMEKLSTYKGDTAQALAYNTLYLRQRDSLDLLLKSNVTRDIGRELENKEQSVANDALEKESARKSFQLVIVVLLSVLSVICILFIWYNLRRKAKHVKSLERLNREVQSKNAELISAYASLEKGQNENARITLAVAHDLKNSVSRVNGTVSNMLKKQPVDDMRDAMELIKSACNNSITLIDDWIEEKAEYDNNKMELLDMSIITQYCVNILQTKADDKNQQLSFKGVPVIVPINRQKIWRVISNLLNNAIKFSPENSVINIKLQKHKAHVLLSVEDHGIGIPPELNDKIFTSHPDASRLGTAGEESHGLGLFISLKIVEEHHGRMWFENNRNKGCTFYIELLLTANVENAV